jgi:exodeoxyribonuclease-5
LFQRWAILLIIKQFNKEELLNEVNNSAPPSRTQQRRTERRRRDREKRKLLNQGNGTTDQLEAVTVPVSKAHRRLTVADLDSDQLEAYNGIKEWWTVQQNIGGTAKPVVLSGYSGTGKSTLMSLVLSDLENPDGSTPYVKSAAYTGKAADVLRKKGVACDTLHYLLYNWLPEGNRLVPIKKDRDEVGADLIVVDEASMLANDLRQDLEELCIPIVYLGDIGQLSAIVTDKNDTRPNVMSEPDFMLTHVHRQALESGIISVATDVRLGKNVDKGVYGVKKDMIKLGSDALNDKDLIANADTVICYYNKTRHFYNDMIRTYRGFSGSFPEVGERLICIRNNREMGLVNGLVVFVKHIVYEGGTLVMDLVDEVGKEFYKVQVHPEYFLGKEHPPMTGKLTKNYFEFGYALTGHKVQGSSFGEIVVIEENMKGRISEKRRWMYTAITRAEHKCTWISKFR